MKTSLRIKLVVSLIASILPAAMLMLGAQTSQAAFAIWNLNPGSGDWNTATNWTPATVPNGAADTAIFGVSNTTSLSLSANTEVDGIVFTPGASAYADRRRPHIYADHQWRGHHEQFRDDTGFDCL